MISTNEKTGGSVFAAPHAAIARGIALGLPTLDSARRSSPLSNLQRVDLLAFWQLICRDLKLLNISQENEAQAPVEPTDDLDDP
jgi:hypothetical protein